MIRPSALPMLAACPSWESSGGNADTDAGTLRHLYLKCLLSGCKFVTESDWDGHEGGRLKALSGEDRAAVEWAAEYVRVKAPTSDHKLLLEHHVNPLDAEFKPIFPNGGTLDVDCGPVLFDLKWRERDYEAQMAAYALGMFQQDGWQEIEVHLLFAETKRAQVFKLTEAGAEAIVNRIVAAVNDPNRKPNPCDYCGWCARRLTCPALLEKANAVIAGREDWKLEQWHGSKIESAEEMGKALCLARQLSDWCESVEFHAKEMALKKGMMPTGFKLQQRQGNRFVSSVSDAFPLAGLPQAEFLKACDCKPSALFEAYAIFNQLPKATAEKEVCRKLGDVLQHKQSTVSLVAEKGK